MTVRPDSYSSTAEVLTFTRHLLDGETTFNSTTRPTLTEVERFIDRASGHLNVAFAKTGLATPIVNSTAVLTCDDWVTARAAEYVELTQRGVGYSEGEGSRTAAFHNLARSAEQFAKENALGFKYLGVTQVRKASDGLQFTGQTAQVDRADPSDTSLEQPKFKRGLFDESTALDFTDDTEET
jgi:hypothetical protein